LNRTALGIAIFAAPFVSLGLVWTLTESLFFAAAATLVTVGGLQKPLEAWRPLHDVPSDPAHERQDALHGLHSSIGAFAGLIGAHQLVSLVVPWSWPVDGILPTLGQGLLVLLFGDLCFYAYHRACHATNGFWWRVHAVHHSITYFTGIHGGRAHVIETPMVFVFYGTVGALMGIELAPALMGLIFSSAIASNQHLNVDATLGPLEWLFVSSNHHRWHHDLDGYPSCNYANIFPFWDMLFGTYQAPLPAPRAVGLQGAAVPDDVWAQQLSVRDDVWGSWEQAWRAEHGEPTVGPSVAPRAV
jgi:sterol desaturase/sphingolipid hydroxylase (fatty acid hydroxylase superfamily)